MAMNLTPGKLAGMNAVSDERGVIAAMALDQRGLLKNMIAKELGSVPPDEMVMEFKSLVASTLSKESSAILLDVEYGLAATKNIHGKGLLLSYEKAGYSPQFPEKLPSLTEGWSVKRLKEAGASAIKLLVFYSPFEDAWVNEQKKAFVERVGAECQGLDMPLFLEFLGYRVGGGDETGLEYAMQKAEILKASLGEFSKDRYAADVLKIEVPFQMAYTAGTSAYKGEQAYAYDEALGLFREVSSLTDKPIVYLSAGVTSEAFIETLQMAAESGGHFHGVLCGRASWQGGIPVFVKQGAAGLQDWLNTTGLQNVRNVNEVLKLAQPWSTARSMQT
jgi:tagatose 1,6-diphosphate aldolase